MRIPFSQFFGFSGVYKLIRGAVGLKSPDRVDISPFFYQHRSSQAARRLYAHDYALPAAIIGIFMHFHATWQDVAKDGQTEDLSVIQSNGARCVSFLGWMVLSVNSEGYQF